MSYKHAGTTNSVRHEEMTKDRKDEGVFGKIGDQENS